jgi:hypothetical protein
VTHHDAFDDVGSFDTLLLVHDIIELRFWCTGKDCVCRPGHFFLYLSSGWGFRETIFWQGLSNPSLH